MDWKDRSTCVLFGDGAAGVLLERSESAGGILVEELGSKGEDYEVLTARRLAPANVFNKLEPQKECGHVTMDGRAVFKFATKKIVSGVEHVLETAGLSTSGQCKDCGSGSKKAEDSTGTLLCKY